MNYRQHAKGAALCFAAAVTVFLLFAQPGACRTAAAEALALCGAPLLVGVYPFLIVSNLIAGSGAAPVLAVPLRPAARVLGCRSQSAAAVLLVGALGGFAPAGAAAAGLYRRGEVTAREAALLLAAAAGSSPSFVMLSVGQGMLGSLAVGMRLYFCQLAAAWLSTGLIARLMRQGPARAGICTADETPQPALPPVTLSSAIGDASLTYIKLCGFVVYFRIMAGALAAYLPAQFSALPAILLEVSSGCQAAAALPQHAAYACCAALSVQGLSVLAQLRTLCPAAVSLRPLLAIRPLHLALSLGLFRLSLCGGRTADVYSSLESRVIALPRLPLPCTVLLFILCLLLCGRLCRALQQAEK